MTILGVIVRSLPRDVEAVARRLAELPGVDLAERTDGGDGRLVVVIEDSAETSAAATLGAIALWREVLNTALVYEYSGPDSPAPDSVEDYRAWRDGLSKAAAAAAVPRS